MTSRDKVERCEQEKDSEKEKHPGRQLVLDRAKDGITEEEDRNAVREQKDCGAKKKDRKKAHQDSAELVNQSVPFFSHSRKASADSGSPLSIWSR
jgi:hypothetical protein